MHLIRPKTGRAGHYLKEVKIILKKESVLIVLKKDGPKEAQVAFIEAAEFDEAIWVLSQEIKSKRVQWKEDRWRKMRVDKK